MQQTTALSYPVRSYTDKDLDEFFELDAEQTKKLKKKGLLETAPKAQAVEKYRKIVVDPLS